MIQLFNYQQICVDFIKSNRGLILYHSMGSGKTITSLAMATQFNNSIIIITTKASKKNFLDDIKKAKVNSDKITLITYKKVISKIQDRLIDFKNKIIIIDEAHRLRSRTKLLNIIITECFEAFKLILLTGTIFYNDITDLSVLINMVKFEDILPESSKEFKFFYYDSTYETPTNIELLMDKLKNCISYYKKPLDENYPKYETKIIKVDMDNAQISEYRFYVKKILALDTLHIDYNIIDQRKANFFLNVTRQISNTVNNSEKSPKINEIYKYIKDGPRPVIVYSNFLESGVLPLSLLLNNNKISYGIYHGGQTDEKRDNLIDQYNSGNIDVLLITTAGSESLDLKNTRQIHIMEMHWNMSKIDQIIGRAIRYKSHNSLPIDQRNVVIYKWISVFGYKIPYETADEYIYKKALAKEKMFEQFNEIIKLVTI
jgi:superfamily II DNA or RNA helicase